jgi:hypothetical protein
MVKKSGKQKAESRKLKGRGEILNLKFTAIPQEGFAWSGKTGWC